MSSPISGSSFVFQDVYIQSVGTTAGIVEHQGPLGHYFDKHYPNHYHHHASYEQAEIEMLKDAILICLKKGKVKVGCFSSVCTSWLPDIMNSFEKEYPDITIEVFQGTYDDVTYWLKNGVVDIGFLSMSSAGDIPIEPLYKDPLVCVVPKGFFDKDTNEIMHIAELRNHQFVTQRESTDADIQNFLKENSLNVQSNYHVVDDLSTVALVSNGFGICIMPELVMRDIPYEVDYYQIEPDAYRIIGIATMNPGFMAPAVRTMYNHILKQYKNI